MNTLRQAAALFLGAILLSGCASNAGSSSVAKKAPDNGISVEGAQNFAGKTDVVIGNFSVTFVTFDKSTATATSPWYSSSTGSAKSSLRASLKGVDDQAFQTITDNIYADFKSKLTAAGYNVQDLSQLAGSKGYSKLKFETSPLRHTSGFKSITGGTREDVVFAPTGRQLMKAGLGNGTVLPYAVYEIALKEGLSVLDVSLTVNFAGFDKSTDYAVGFSGDHYNAKVSMGQNVQAEATSTRIVVANGLESTFNHPNSLMTLTRSIATAEPFGTVADTTSGMQKAANLVSGVLGAVSGSSSSAKDLTVQADPAKYQTLATKALQDANARFVESISALK